MPAYAFPCLFMPFLACFCMHLPYFGLLLSLRLPFLASIQPAPSRSVFVVWEITIPIPPLTIEGGKGIDRDGDGLPQKNVSSTKNEA